MTIALLMLLTLPGLIFVILIIAPAFIILGAIGLIAAPSLEDGQ
jgi:hypothetical protein